MMLEKIQHSLQGPVTKALLFVIIIFFVFAGYFSASLFSGSVDKVAEVEGVEITSAQVQQRFDSVRSQLGQQFDVQYATEASQVRLRAEIVQQLTNEQIIRATVVKAGFTASDKQISDWVKNEPAFQFAGSYSEEQARTVLAQNGWGRQELSSFVTSAITREQFMNGILESGFSLDAEVGNLYRLQEQVRNVRAVKITAKSFEDSVVVTDEEVATYYNDNQAQFEQAEQINLNYVRLSAAEMTAQAKSEITDEEIATYYEQNSANYSSTEEVELAHILIESSTENAKETAEDLLAQLNNGADFAALAEEHSADTFSGEQGGLLDWMEISSEDDLSANDWVSQFKKTSQSLANAGDYSDVIETELGFHIIKLNERRGGSVTPLAEVREDILTVLAADLADTRFYEKQADLNEKWLEFGDSIEQFAGETSLAMKETGTFSQFTGTDVAANPVVVERAFSSEIVDSTEVSEAIDLGDKDILYIAKKEYFAAFVKPLDEVKEQITASLKQDKAELAAKEFSDSALEMLKNGESVDAKLAEHDFVWVENAFLKSTDVSFGYDLLGAVFKQVAPMTGEKVRAIESLTQGNYALVEILEVTYPELTDADEVTKTQLSTNLTNAQSQNDLQGLLEASKAEITVK